MTKKKAPVDPVDHVAESIALSDAAETVDSPHRTPPSTPIPDEAFVLPEVTFTFPPGTSPPTVTPRTISDDVGAAGILALDHFARGHYSAMKAVAAVLETYRLKLAVAGDMRLEGFAALTADIAKIQP